MQLEEAQKRRLFLAVLAGLALLLIVVSILVVTLGEEPAGEGANQQEEEMLISDSDGAQWIPKFNLSQNTYDPEKFKVIDGYLQYDDVNARLGVDVSEYQEQVDWAAVKAAGVDFAMLRIGYRGMTQGGLNQDSTFERNYTEATNAGLFVGVYFFSQAVTEAEAVEEAEFVIRTLNGRKPAYPVAFDWERPEPTAEVSADRLRALGATGEQITACSVAFCEKIKEAGYIPCVYTNKDLAYHFFDMSQWKDYDIWYAEYQNAPTMYYDFRIWQYSESTTVPGINVPVDMDICFKPY